MGNAELFDLIKQLPADKQKTVEELVFALASESGVDVISVSDTHDDTFNKKPTMSFGALKGFVKYIADDFDEPLEDFKDYM